MTETCYSANASVGMSERYFATHHKEISIVIAIAETTQRIPAV